MKNLLEKLRQRFKKADIVEHEVYHCMVIDNGWIQTEDGIWQNFIGDPERGRK